MKKRTFWLVVILSAILYISGFVIALTTNTPGVSIPPEKVNYLGPIIAIVGDTIFACTAIRFIIKNQKPTNKTDSQR